MAVKSSETVYTDDMSPEVEGTEKEGFLPNIAFMYRGQYYEIDLGAANVVKFDKALAPFIKVARPVDAPKGPLMNPALKEWNARAIQWLRATPLVADAERPKGGFPSKEQGALYIQHNPTDPKPVKGK